MSTSASPSGPALGASAAGAVAALAVSLAVAAAMPAAAQDTKPVYRCPGPPVLYTDQLTPQQAAERGCRRIEGAPLTIVQTQPRPTPVADA